jgi:hypothetical protein
MEVPKMFNTLEEIAKRDREKAKLEGNGSLSNMVDGID